MANPIFVGAGVTQYGAAVGMNRGGQLISGHRTEPGHWSFTNQANGNELEAVHQQGRGWEVTRTNAATGEQQVGDFTVVSRPRPGGGRAVAVLDLDRDGFQPLNS
ncbi:MAG: hypothetical protein HY319_27260 [Armatimonadetes bacterium]|nr:hypothetical protein [Armatimonadota bacterium]